MLETMRRSAIKAMLCYVVLVILMMWLITVSWSFALVLYVAVLLLLRFVYHIYRQLGLEQKPYIDDSPYILWVWAIIAFWFFTIPFLAWDMYDDREKTDGSEV